MPACMSACLLLETLWWVLRENANYSTKLYTQSPAKEQCVFLSIVLEPEAVSSFQIT